MTNQPVDADTDLAVVPEISAPDISVSEISTGSAVWRPGSNQNGLDDRVEFADLGERIAVRDSDRPDAPGLLFAREDWEQLCGLAAAPEIDLRD